MSLVQTANGKTVYRAVPGSHIKNTDAAVIGDELEKLKRKDGTVRPERMWQEAEGNPKHPLYKFFDWNVRKAAEKHWTEQARHLIRSVQVTIVSAKRQEPIHVRGFVSVVKKDDHGGKVYEPIATVMTTKEYTRQLLERALYELNIWEEKYKTIKELAGIFEAIRDTRATLKQT